MLAHHGSARSIARGAGLGVFIAFTPTIGFQVLLAIVLATSLKANRRIAVATVFITNPLTLAPIYAVTYGVGKLFMDGPSVYEAYTELMTLVRQLAALHWYDLIGAFAGFLELGRELLLPMTIGGLIVGALLGLTTYFSMLRLVAGFRLARQFRQRLRADVRAKQHKASANRAATTCETAGDSSSSATEDDHADKAGRSDAAGSSPKSKQVA